MDDDVGGVLKGGAPCAWVCPTMPVVAEQLGDGWDVSPARSMLLSMPDLHRIPPALFRMPSGFAVVTYDAAPTRGAFATPTT